MSRLLRRTCTLVLCLLMAPAAYAGQSGFRFAVISHVNGESALAHALAAADAENLAFVVVNGFKAAAEPCNDRLLERRADILRQAQHGVIVSLAASDWTACRDASGRSTAISRLTRVRELLYADEFSLGSSRLPLVRQATNPRFRAYVENARWEVGEIMFATVNLPANNNNYLTDAGRNSEFEDRMVANREWLQRVFVHARQKKMQGIVLLSDSSPLGMQRQARRDGYLELRRDLTALSNHYEGRVLLIHGEAARPAPKAIRWQGRLGELNAGSGTVHVKVETEAPWFLLSAAENGER